MSASDPGLRPLVGICAAWDRAAWSFWDQEAALVAGTYLDAVPVRTFVIGLSRIQAQTVAAELNRLQQQIDYYNP